MNATKIDSIKEFYTSKILPRKLVCCSKKRKQVAMEKARASLNKEVDIIKLIRSRRFVHAALKQLLDPALRKELKQKSRFEVIDIDESEPQSAATNVSRTRNKSTKVSDLSIELQGAKPEAQDESQVQSDPQL